MLTKTGWKLYCDPILMFIIKTAKMGSCWRPLKCHRTFTCIGCVRVCVVWFSKKNAGVFWKQRVCGFCSDFWTIACTNRKFSCAATGFQSAAVNLPAAILLSLWSVFSTVISYKLSNLKSSSITLTQCNTKQTHQWQGITCTGWFEHQCYHLKLPTGMRFRLPD